MLWYAISMICYDIFMQYYDTCMLPEIEIHRKEHNARYAMRFEQKLTCNLNSLLKYMKVKSM